jgi:hypothetical protein
MKTLPKQISSLNSKPFAIPLVLLAVTVLAYGLSFWRMGFYWDDQPISWIRYQLGTEATTRYFSDSRPVWALLYQLTGYILPQNPACWQLFAMFWRWAVAVVFWLVMAGLFPGRRDLAFLLSLFTLLYPGFNQQWVSYVYSHFFIVLFFLLLSWHLMLRGKTIPALIFSALHLLMFEYFFLLEFMRPAILFLSLWNEPMTARERYAKVFRTWLPYIGVVILVVLYRMVVYSHPGFGYSLTEEVARAPIETLTQLVLHVLSSLWAAAGGAWIQAFEFPDPAINGLRTSVLYVFVVLAVGGFVIITNVTLSRSEGSLSRQHETLRSPGPLLQSDRNRDALWLIGLGAVMLLMGGVPYWVTNLPVSLEFPANRALLSFMFGACFLLVGFLELLPARFRYWVAVLLVSLSAGRHSLWSVDYVREWEAQKNLFWQMVWRAPGLKPNTLVLMNEELSYNADNSISAPLNWIYAPDLSGNQIPYVLFYPTNRLGRSLPELKKDVPIRYSYTAGEFNGNTSQAIVFYYDPPACLRLLDPDLDPDNRLISPGSLMREASALSNADGILAEETAVMPDIYAPEPEHKWCYYFQKADLARQFGDWDEVVRLGDIAFELGDYPNDPVERFVFIEGYAHMGQWRRALELSAESYGVSKEFVGPLLCRLWERIATGTGVGLESEALTDQAVSKRREALSEARSMFLCNP